MNTHRSITPASEPALTVGGITALVSAVLALAVVLGLALPAGFEAALLAVIAAGAPIVAGIVTRAKVVPSVKVVEQEDHGMIVAGPGHDTIPEGQRIRAVHDAP